MLKTLCIAAGLMALAAPAIAADSLQAPTKAVSTASVDFHNSAAVRAFYSRLKTAANMVCDSYSANSRVTQADIACAHRALAEAVRNVDRPLLTAMYENDGATRLASR